MAGRPRNAVEAKPFCIMLQDLRIAGYDRVTLAQTTGLTHTSIRLIENGTTRWIYPETAKRLANLLIIWRECVRAMV